MTGNHPHFILAVGLNRVSTIPLGYRDPAVQPTRGIEVWGGVYKAVIVLTLGDGLVDGPIHSV